MMESDIEMNSFSQIWDKYGRLFVVFIIVGVTIISGVRYMDNAATAKSKQASALYNEMALAAKAKDYEIVKDRGEQLIKGYAKTPYPQLAALLLAKVAIENKDFEKAKHQFLWVMDNKRKEDKIWNIAKVRLARVLKEQGHYDEALDLLNSDHNGFTSLYEEVRGDILAEKGDIQGAIDAYKIAKAALPRDENAPWLSMKLINLGEETELNA